MKRLLHLLLAFVGILSLTACSGEAEDISEINQQTILVFMPWSGSASDRGLYSAFQANLDSIESAMRRSGGTGGRVLVFLSTTPESATLYEITRSGQQTIHTQLQTYSGNLYTTADGIAQILNDVKTYAYALNYALIVGCHGCGWTYKSDWENYPYRSKRRMAPQAQPSPYPTTRFYGSVSDMNYATDVSTLAQGIEAAGIKMQYILFDDCYMANVETAYELRNATNYLIASTSEVMRIGMPYQTMWSSLARQAPAYQSAVNAFNAFYSGYDIPCGALSVIDCRQLEPLAQRMKLINDNFTLPDSLRDSLQVLDGFNQSIFYDMGDYVARLCRNNDMLNDFNDELATVIKASSHTDSLYTYLYDKPAYITVRHFSGITISDPSLSPVALKGREKTAWWQATH